jgi:XTP/dITP diphosphohydrolase
VPAALLRGSGFPAAPLLEFIMHDQFLELVAIIQRLRKECPWDSVQTNDSIKAATIEEAYEVVQAIDEKDYAELKKELGDLLLHVVFHSVIAEESGHFQLSDVIREITEKLIRRHPHIFSDTKADTAEEVKQNWETIKLEEGRKSVIDGLPIHLPALQRAHRMQDKVAKVGFDWNHINDVWAKVEEEMGELREAVQLKNQDEIENEFGDLLFSLVNYARFVNVNPEDALRRTIAKFESRFHYIEDRLAEQNRKITESNLEEMDKYWNESKTALKK